MSRKNKKYDKDFKLEAAKLVVEHGYSCAEARMVKIFSLHEKLLIYC